MTIDLCPLEIINEIINKSDVEDENFNYYKAIHEHFNNEILIEDQIKLIPDLASKEFSSNSNYSLVKVSSGTIVQDCLEDEFFQPFIRVKDDDSIVNTGLWTRYIYDPLEKIDLNSGHEPVLNNLQVRKRMLARCTKTGKSFIVALYRKDKNETDEEWEKWRQETFKMNSVHNLIGLLEVNEIEENEDSNEFLSNLPTLHLIKRSDHFIENLVEIKEENVEEIGIKLMKYLETCCNNNKIAAEALMLSLVSRPSMRVEGLVESLFIGKLTLNLCVVNGENASEELKKILMKIKPFVSGPVRINSNPQESFNLKSIYPQLDVQSGQLKPGAALQQPDGNVLIVDETSLNEGEFKDQGVCNLQALIDLIRHQHVNYDFGMQQITLKTDIPVILVSLAKKSVLPFDLKVECESIQCVEDVVDDADLNLFRSYLHHCRALTCEIDEEMAEYLEKEYLNLRKSSPLLENGNPKMNEQEFHRLINLARLLAISRGRTGLSKEIWTECVGLYN